MSGILVHRMLWPSANWTLESLLVDVSEASGFDEALHGVVLRYAGTGASGSTAEGRSYTPEKGILWQGAVVTAG